jgi:hypothetical protein
MSSSVVVDIVAAASAFTRMLSSRTFAIKRRSMSASDMVEDIGLFFEEFIS